MKCLNFSTPYEVLLANSVALGNWIRPVGTCLDGPWGIDAFFSIGASIVTFDISLRGHKSAGRLRADFLVTPEDIDENFADVGKRIALLLTKRKTGIREPYRPRLSLRP